MLLSNSEAQVWILERSGVGLLACAVLFNAWYARARAAHQSPANERSGVSPSDPSEWPPKLERGPFSRCADVIHQIVHWQAIDAQLGRAVPGR